jgi:hypothetical protein
VPPPQLVISKDTPTAAAIQSRLIGPWALASVANETVAVFMMNLLALVAAGSAQADAAAAAELVRRRPC